MAAGEKNAYWCSDCEQYLITVDVAQGVTPFIVRCRNCGGDARSQLYPEEPWPATDPAGRTIPNQPTHEWYMPTLEAARRMGEGTLDHVTKGGLVLRERA
jgi:hypothetical protein